MRVAHWAVMVSLCLLGCDWASGVTDSLGKGACAPVPGPPDARFSDHIEGTKLSKRLPDEAKRHPDLGMSMSTTSLMMTFARNATVAEANAALCSAPIQVVSAMKAGILVVQVLDVRDFSDLDDAKTTLAEQKAVESVSHSLEMKGGPPAPLGKRSRPKKDECAWAPSQIVKAHGLTPRRCRTSTTTVDGKDVHVGVVHIDKSTIFAIVDDDGVHPLRLHSPSASAAGNILRLTDRELKTQDSPKLTGQQHWSQKTKRGWHWVDVMIHRGNSRVPRAANPFGDLRAQYRTELASVHGKIRTCLDRYVRKHPEAVGEPIRVYWMLSREGSVGSVSVYDLGDKSLSFQAGSTAICIGNKLRGHMKFPPGHEKVNRILFTERLVLERPPPGEPTEPARKKSRPFVPGPL